MGSFLIDGKEHLPERPAFFMPNRMPCLQALQELERLLGGPKRVFWLVEESHLPGEEIMGYLRTSGAAGYMTGMGRESGTMLVERIRDTLGTGRHVVLITGPRETGNGATICDLSGRLLSHLDGCSLTITPIYVGLFNHGMTNAVTNSAPCDTIRMRLLPQVNITGIQSARIMESWLDCAADMFAELSVPGDVSLPRMLLESMQEHPAAQIIDGVDDSTLNFKNLLSICLMFARRLRSRITHKRLGIILPPGKRAVIANISCMLAGISPVNINYTAPAELVQQMLQHARVTRFITDTRFVSKQRDFQWPPTRDLLYIDEIMEELGSGRRKFWSLVVRYIKTEHLLRYLKLPQKKADDEVALVFSSSTTGGPKAIPLTHRMVIANLMGIQSRMCLEPGSAILAAAPLFSSSGFIPGLLMPLLYGYNMVTYPEADVGQRLRDLVKQHAVSSVIAPTPVIRAFVTDTEDEPLESLKYFVAAGGAIPPGLAEAVQTRLHTALEGAYTLSEAGSLVSLSLHNEPTTHANTRTRAPYLRGVNSGRPMPGIAISISDPRQPNRRLPLNTPGLVWVKGAALTTRYQDNEAATIDNIRNGWLRTGDIGLVDADGCLHIFGTRERYAMVRGEFVPHEAVENMLAEGYGVARPTDGTRRLAVVTMMDQDARDHLVVLSTLEEHRKPVDIKLLQYAVRNEGYSINWCPELIIPVQEIPLLPNGRIDYAQCCAMARAALEQME
ncbi:MAG: AMP-binding protein [Akkermansia sp.]|nr:AMP-binding protein [Akkermansia sp.]